MKINPIENVYYSIETNSNKFIYDKKLKIDVFIQYMYNNYCVCDTFINLSIIMISIERHQNIVKLELRWV